MAEYIYSMVRARKAVGEKLILDDVTMAFLPGAKIGMVGPNGAGKSTILKIMAGLDTPSNGEAKLTPGFTVGILMQEPELDETKTVLENIQEGVAIKAKLDRFNEISALMADPDADFDALLAEMGVLQEEIDAADGWDLDSQLEQAMDALRTRPATSP
jgi:ATPase subunit of ABC transporter with duplicated ATPase domains